ncbi:MAG: ImmA/IrrE family metallo-endopeptidase [Vulcanimicrobiaceae bacterium]
MAAGLTLEEAARGIGMSGPAAKERLAEMERGELEPSRTQIAAMAKRYHRPLLTFYLNEPPKPGNRNQDFRMLPVRDPAHEALLDAIVRDARVRQALLRSALEEEEQAEPLPVVGSVHENASAEELRAAMANALRFNLHDYRSARTIAEAFAILRSAVEALGVYVLLIGNLGNYRSNVSPLVFRGFSFASAVAPFVVINETDAQSAWSFTLMHELAHVFLGQSDISGYGGDDRLERVCDDAASAFLLPADEFLRLDVSAESPLETLIGDISGLADDFKVSRTMVAYRLLCAGKLSAAKYAHLVQAFDSARESRAQSKGGGGGPNYYVLRRHRLGKSLIGTVTRMVDAGALTTSKAGRVLGVKPTAVHRITTRGEGDA